MKNKRLISVLICTIILILGCSAPNPKVFIQDVNGIHEADTNQVWLTHEHILVDFIGADSIQPKSWDHDSILKEILPYFEELKELKVNYFVDATPDYLGRDPVLLQKIANKTGIRIITNTGLYGARNDIFIPEYAKEIPAENLAGKWIDEYRNGIEGTSIKPGFIKIGIDNRDSLSILHQKLVKAAALTHLQTGLTIASHTGEAKGMWPQLEILKEMGVSPEAFIWVHAQNEKDNNAYLEVAKTGCWISLDGMGWEMENHIQKIVFAKEHGILDRILISHDAGWYDPQKKKQDIKPFTAIFTKLYPELKSRGFTDAEFHLLTSVNPSKAFSIKIRKIQPE
ncbi:MAG: phosphotriesterase [Prolixibacteraceae bacterium]